MLAADPSGSGAIPHGTAIKLSRADSHCYELGVVLCNHITRLATPGAEVPVC